MAEGPGVAVQRSAGQPGVVIIMVLGIWWWSFPKCNTWRILADLGGAKGSSEPSEWGIEDGLEAVARYQT